MRWILLHIIFFTSLALLADSIAPDFVSAAKEAKKSVVYIASFTKKGTKIKQIGFGSGTIVKSDGHLVTNYHVVKGANYYEATLYDGTHCTFKRFTSGSYYKADSDTDLAVMKLFCPKNELIPIKRGSSLRLNEGDWVMAIGNPYGLSNSITKGIVSSTNRSDVGFTSIEDFIQTDVPINPGNSGGPLVNLSGEMIGINTAIRTVSGGFQGISFSIPIEIVNQVYRDLVQYGRVRRGWVGILIHEKETNNSNVKKVYIDSTLNNSPAQLIGLQRGDLILEVDDSTIHSKSQLTKIIKNRPIGSRLIIVVQRSTIIKRFSITMNEKAYYQKVGTALNRLYSNYGIKLDLNTQNEKVVVSDTSLKRLQSGDIYQGDLIIGLNGNRIQNLSDFASIYKRSGYFIKRLTLSRGKLQLIVRFK